MLQRWALCLVQQPRVCLFCRPGPSMHRGSSHLGSSSGAPATAGIYNWAQAMSSAWPQYQGNFSMFLLSPQIGPLADANKAPFMGNIVHRLLLHCIFYAHIPQSIFTDKCHCLPLQMAPRRKHRKLSGSTKVTQKKSEQRWEQNSSSLLPGLSPAPSQA